MQTCFKKASGLPQYINMLEDLQKQVLRMDRNDPITDQTILGLTEADVLSSAQFPASRKTGPASRRQARPGRNGNASRL